MRKPLARLPRLLPLLVLALALCACGGGDMPASGPASWAVSSLPADSSAAPDASVAPDSSSAPDSSVAGTPDAGDGEDTTFVNAELTGYIGQPLSALEHTLGQDYFIYEVGSTTGAMEYYEPYIGFYFDPVGYFNLSGKPENAWDPDPFATDRLLIRRVNLCGEVDPETGAVTDQASLRRLFATDAAITYALLAEKLGQAPTLEHNPQGAHYGWVPYEIGSTSTPVPGGTYSAAYTIGGWAGSITFHKTGDDYLACRVTFGDDTIMGE